jgi:hypothetical protein
MTMFIAFPVLGNPHEQEIQRALIQRDQQSAEFAAGADRPQLQQLHDFQMRGAGQPLHPDPAIARELRPYERQRMASEREGFVLRLPPPRILEREEPLPLPGGPRHGVEPVTPDGVGG